MFYNTVWIYVNLLLLLFLSHSQSDDVVSAHSNVKSTDLAHEPDDRLLLFSTLDGSLHAIEQQTGRKRWKLHDRSVVKVPVDTTDALLPLFLPDPRDGSLYLIGSAKEPLKKLPFTVPQLVASAPCRSSDGILYTGKKKDMWFTLDPATGERQQILSWDDVSPTCPVQSPNAVYVGRTLYSIMMVDSRNANRRWNVTFWDYAASPMDKDMLNNYNLVHFSSSSNGRLLTMDRRRGSLLWEDNLGSPVVAAYILDPNGLVSLPFTGLANHTLAHLATHLLTHQQPFQIQPAHMKLYPTLYIGEHTDGLYAVPSLVDQNMVTITASEIGPLLLEGPGAESPRPYPDYPIPGQNYHLPEGLYDVDPFTFQSIPGYENFTIVFIGHYNVPEYSSSKLMISGRTDSNMKLITDESSKYDTVSQLKDHTSSIGIQTDFDENETTSEKLDYNKDRFDSVVVFYNFIRNWVNQQENKGLKLLLIVLVGCIIAMFWYLQMQVREFQQWSRNGSGSSQSSTSDRSGSVTAVAEELPGGLVKVGKIVFNPEELLGKGCEGTFVYRGEFDTRKVAVKRLLPECFNFADREVALLRESDAHPHVVRYFCMEQDRMFRYIALELCQATLHDYIQGRCETHFIAPLQILYQATAGLAHLHSLDIVHRDIKPQNVLLSVPNVKGEVRAMISDFGLCKKLQVGRISFSRRSGITGTDGWIAPEMLNGSERTTYAVDLFSLGCLYYNVLSEGGHPFGDALHRQANILSGDSNLGDLKGHSWQIALQKPLLTALISPDPSDRPSCPSILAHPMFWNNSTILAFFQDVSDRVEKAESNDLVLKKLEEGAEFVVQRDWRLHIHDEVASDLRKYRTYRGDSVRDLLRALRNKKHHFRELSTEAQHTLGEPPENFTNYWTTKFPLLLLHTWYAMQCVAHEKTFSHYYPASYCFHLDLKQSEIQAFDVSENYFNAPENYLNAGENYSQNVLVYRSPRRRHLKEAADDYRGGAYKLGKSNKKLPKNSRINPYGEMNVRSNDVQKLEGLGLYRNNRAELENRINSEVLLVNSDTKYLETDTNHNNQKEVGNACRKTKNKKLNKVPDEPLLWSVAPGFAEGDQS